MSTSDNDSTEEDCQTRSEQIVCGESAGQSGYVDGHRVRSIDRCCALYIEPKATLRRRRDHIEHEDGAHSVVAEALPKLRKEERSETFWVSDKTVITFFFKFGGQK